MDLLPEPGFLGNSTCNSCESSYLAVILEGSISLGKTNERLNETHSVRSSLLLLFFLCFSLSPDIVNILS